MQEDLRIAIIVNPELSLGLLANTVGAVSIGLGAKYRLSPPGNSSIRQALPSILVLTGLFLSFRLILTQFEPFY